ncbi:MAG TPA: hypothetical protein VNQ73_10190 [Ilumatobacter sp.]|nr:hypothetical protein [Ilumatobacter sp.]
MILPWPLTTSAELAQVLRPGGRLRPDSALRQLRDKGLGAAAITVVPRSELGARGKAVWYSSLMLDAARLVRVGDTDAAAEVHAAATELATHRAAQFVADWLVEHAGTDPSPADLDADTGGALTRLGLLTASARSRFADRLGVEQFAGRVLEVSGRTALLVDEHCNSLPIPVDTSRRTVAPGALIAVDTEQFDSGAATIWVRAAFAVDDDPNTRHPGGVRLLTDAERRSARVPTPSPR